MVSVGLPINVPCWSPGLGITRGTRTADQDGGNAVLRGPTLHPPDPIDLVSIGESDRWLARGPATPLLPLPRNDARSTQPGWPREGAGGRAKWPRSARGAATPRLGHLRQTCHDNTALPCGSPGLGIARGPPAAWADGGSAGLQVEARRRRFRRTAQRQLGGGSVRSQSDGLSAHHRHGNLH
jgi:hypothetical protein